ncbi:3-oxoadipate enol-lactonase 2 [Penicillium ucsense]|uniref:3-oxoadipate enol-lactonase 2 n=1 Tax=Penicillium ucsense TaxID=2839758 RepID=A0A8J8WKE9_9EURO|nr:3-oxoadipate enol-lactonase 2 [Penicillium ucsense]KAF7734936.1 3-oxoadipate enol-lactonase 2 [Penicillium ucsense]
MSTPGLLYVTMQPQGSLPEAQFHDWYNTEHGPLRLRLPFVTNGFRFRATDGEKPEYVALYDITDMAELTRKTYLDLRTDLIKTEREKATMAQIDVGRLLYDLVYEQKSPNFRPLENQADTDAETRGSVLVAVTTTIDADPEKQAEHDRWYREEHIDMLSRVPGWRRSRLFVTSSIDPQAPRHSLALHEYAPQNGLGGDVHKAAMNTPWREKLQQTAVKSKQRRVYQWYYTFGPAPRELSSLASPDCKGPWSSNDGKTRTFPSAARPAVESFITTKDGVELPYRLEGSTDPNAPVVVLSNSILVDWNIWDRFVDAFFARQQNQRYRVLRYLTRGRRAASGQQPVTVDLLASDVADLLEALRVPPKAARLIGVSLGGVTVLNTSLLYPERVAAFIACDTNSSAPESNRKAWGDRVAMSEQEGSTDPETNEPIVGEQLAEITTRRWFVPESYETQPEVLAPVKEAVRTNSLKGFAHGVNALCAYDIRDRMGSATVPGLFVAGANDGVLPQTMQKMAADLKGGADLKIIEKAGHLPMVEQPEPFADVVTEFLGKIDG